MVLVRWQATLSQVPSRRPQKDLTMLTSTLPVVRTTQVGLPCAASSSWSFYWAVFARPFCTRFAPCAEERAARARRTRVPQVKSTVPGLRLAESGVVAFASGQPVSSHTARNFTPQVVEARHGDDGCAVRGLHGASVSLADVVHHGGDGVGLCVELVAQLLAHGVGRHGSPHHQHERGPLCRRRGCVVRGMKPSRCRLGGRRGEDCLPVLLPRGGCGAANEAPLSPTSA